MTQGYIDFVLKNAPRVLTQIDKDSDSATYGSCDRNRWHLKIRDFDSAILQQTGLTLTLLYQLDFPGNIYYNNENVKKWAIASVHYWAKIQLKDGSFNEYYPNEHGFPPSAFSLYSTCEICLRLGMADEYIRNKIHKTARYLCRTIEEKACNQEMASIAGLYNAYKVLGEDWILDGCTKKLDRILAQQSEEGWFPEYGGADIGYLSVCLDMLCEYYRMSGNERVVRPIQNTVEFLKYFVHPDVSAGGEYGSRNTAYFLPAGLEIAISLGISNAYAIKAKLFSAENFPNYFLNSVDERYVSHYLLHSFLRAMEYEVKNELNLNEIPLIPCDSNEVSRYFDKSGLLIFGNEKYYSIVSLSKGGVIYIYDKLKLCFIDCGYRVSYGKALASCTSWQDASYTYSFAAESGTVAVIDGYMNKIKLKSSSPFLLFGLRVAAFIFGRRLIGYLKGKVIFVDNHDDIRFRREICFGDTSVEVKDELFSPKKDVIFESADNMSMRHVASGKFFSLADLLARRKPIKKGRVVKRLLVFDISGNSILDSAASDESSISFSQLKTNHETS